MINSHFNVNSACRALSIAALITMACGPTRAQTPIGPEERVAPKIEITGGTLNFTIQPSVVGRHYQLQASETLATGSWQNLSEMATGDGNDLVISTAYFPSTSRRFYRLALDGTSAVPAGFARVPAGEFLMGDTFSEGESDELPVHTVNLNAFFLQKTEVTKTQWDEVSSWAAIRGYLDLPVGSGEGNQPVNEVNWYDVIKWCNARSEKEGLTPVYMVSGAVFRAGISIPVADWSADGYRLPTEAEWEKAARGGLIGKRFPWGDSISPSQANYRVSDDATGVLVDVASYAANGYGLHDMAGNVWEWCWDLYDAAYYTTSPALDPRGTASGSDRCMRGGCWYDEFTSRLRCANRGNDNPVEVLDDVGFRPARRAGL